MEGSRKCYGANDVLEGASHLQHEGVDVSHRQHPQPQFQHLVAAFPKARLWKTAKMLLRRFRRRLRHTLHPDNMAAAASYSLTDSMGRMHGGT